MLVSCVVPGCAGKFRDGSGLPRDQAQVLLAVGSVLLGKIPVAERLEVFDDEPSVFDRPAKNVGIEKIDQRTASGRASPEWPPAVGRRFPAMDRRSLAAAETPAGISRSS